MPFEMDFPLDAWLRRRSATARAAHTPYVIGVAGSVAAGKSTFAQQLATEIAGWPDHPKVESIATDGFLFPNRVLAARGIAMRKGFPECFDSEALRAAIAAIKRGERVALPLYSHVTYDVSDETRIIEKPAILILDGLHLARIERAGEPRLIDSLFYLDADEAAIETWFSDRLVPLMEAGIDDPTSFYYAFRTMTPDDRRAFAARVWAGINLPNLREHIVHDRDAADLIMHKTAGHRVAAASERAP